MKTTMLFLFLSLGAAVCAMLSSCAEVREEKFVEYHDRLIPGARR